MNFVLQALSPIIFGYLNKNEPKTKVYSERYSLDERAHALISYFESGFLEDGNTEYFSKEKVHSDL